MASEDTAQMDIEEAIKAVKDKANFEQSVQSYHLDAHGREQPNPVPMQPPIGYRKQPSIAEIMRQMIKQASLEAAQHGAETEEEANDFDVGEDFDPTSPWENDFEPDPALDHMLALASKPPKKPVSQPSSVPAGGAEDNA